ncbi:hypothetical protein Peur_014225 [Populus x canadensis]
MGRYTLPKTSRDPLLLVAVIKKRQRYCTDRGYQDRWSPPLRQRHVAKCMNLERYIVNPNKASTVADIDDRCARGSCTVDGSH